MSDREIIKTELGRLKTELIEEGENTMFEQGRISAFIDMEVFIDSLQEEPVSEDLEEAAKKECRGLTDPQEIINCYCQFIRGANWQKQQMMKDAIEQNVDSIWANPINTLKRLGLHNLKGKVKLIIIKQEEK